MSTVTGSLTSIGENSARLWGLSMGERVRRIVVKGGFADEALLANAAYAFDPLWVGHLARRPGSVLTDNGVPVLAHVRNEHEHARVAAAMASEAKIELPPEIENIRYETGPEIENQSLRKRETPFVLRLTPETTRAAERASYFGAYKGVTDLLTKYLWPEWAFVLTRIAARFGISPNAVTIFGLMLCIAATVCFAYGRYWLGMGLGLGFMVLDTVDGKLARCTITSSAIGNVLDHGADIIHPPFWWWFWATGLGTWGLAYDTATFWYVQGAIQIGYVIQRLIEGAFMQMNGTMHIHVWRRFDSMFRLITARRNPNMVILFVAMLFSRPDLGLIVVAWWTVISCAVHAVRLAQCALARMHGVPIRSWLSDN